MEISDIITIYFLLIRHRLLSYLIIKCYVYTDSVDKGNKLLSLFRILFKIFPVFSVKVFIQFGNVIENKKAK